MKKITSKLVSLTSAVVLIGSVLLIQSCSTSSSGTTTPPPTPLGGYVSSDSVSPATLLLYFNFDGSPNESKLGLTGVANGVTYVTGVRGQAYQGDSGAYITVAIPTTDTAKLSHLGSYSVSFWYNMADQPYDTLGTNDPNGVFFLSGSNTGANGDELIAEFEHYTTGNDSVNFHNGFNNLASPGWQQVVASTWDTTGLGSWSHLVCTYNDTTGVYVVYEDGVPVGTNTAWSPTPYSLSNTLLQGPGGATPPNPLMGPIAFPTDEPNTIFIGTWPPGLFGVSASLGLHGSYLGKLDELRIFNSALTQQEVVGLFLNGQAGR